MVLPIRTLLIWLLVLAVPAQAAAAATMTFCGPNHDGQQAALSRQVASAAHAHPGSAAQTLHDHHSVAAQPDAGDSVAASAAAPAKLVKADPHKCGACASCCSGAAILSMVPAVPVPEVSPTVFICVVPAVAAFAAEGPDRPPRVFFA
jgi:hypothetical protein